MGSLIQYAPENELRDVFTLGGGQCIHSLCIDHSEVSWEEKCKGVRCEACPECGTLKPSSESDNKAAALLQEGQETHIDPQFSSAQSEPERTQMAKASLGD